jgi:hypothetical protein
MQNNSSGSIKEQLLVPNSKFFINKPLIENNSLVTIQQDPLFSDPLNSRCQHLTLNITPFSRKILRTHRTILSSALPLSHFLPSNRSSSNNETKILREKERKLTGQP